MTEPVALSERLDRLEAEVSECVTKLDQLRVGLAKLILGVSGHRVQIDLPRDLGVCLDEVTALIVPGRAM